MATSDVPGSISSNNDTLHSGCWAEAKDGSLILVEGIYKDKNNNDTVIYSIFDLNDKNNPIEYRDSMPLNGFETYFNHDRKTDKWLWHDKTMFPWDKIIKDFKPGSRMPTADHVISAAEKVAKSRNLHIDKNNTTIKNTKINNNIGKIIINKIQKAINRIGI